MRAQILAVAALASGLGGAARAEPVPTPVLCAAFVSSCALPSSELGDMNGGQEVNITVGSSQTLSATNSGNTVNGQTIGSGAVDLQKNAFDGFSGIGNFVINTGHNNNLQGSISVNIATLPPH